MEGQNRNAESTYFRAREFDWKRAAVMRMLDAFKNVPGFVRLKKFLIRPFLVNSKMTADTIRQLYDSCDPDHSCECIGIRVFYALLGHMTPQEKARHVAPLFAMFKCLVARLRIHFNCHPCHSGVAVCANSFVPLCVELFRKDEATSGELVQFMANVRRLPEICETLFLQMAPDRYGLDYLAWCSIDERFHTDDIRETDFLMDKLRSNQKKWSVALMKHGFKYSFHQGYYEDRCLDLINTSNVHGQGPMEDFKNSGTLRKQMAVELLVHLLGVDRMNREVLCTLWQSLPDPFITPDELHHLMEPIFLRTPVLVKACARYREMIPGVPSVKQPRSLKHLARVRIREIMVRAHSVGEKGVRSLGLPRSIEDYLWKLETF